MKNIKKWTSLLLALVMAFALAIPAFAADGDTPTGTITIDNAIVGQTYDIYRLLDLESFDTTSGAYTYKVAKKWENFAKTTDFTDYFEVDGQGYVTWKDTTTAEMDEQAKAAHNTARAAAFAKLALAYAKDTTHSIEYDKTEQATAKKDGDTTTTVTFGELPLGYYLVDSTAGVLCSLSTTAPNATIKEKNEVPSVDKEVKEDDAEAGKEWGNKNDADIGQEVEFRTTISVKPGAQNYVLHDKMNPQQLQFKEVTSVVYQSKATGAPDFTTVDGKQPAENTDYTVIPNNTTPNTTDGCAFEVKFENTWLESLTFETGTEYQIVVSYTAIVQPGAVIAGTGNPNETWLKYGDDSTTEHDFTRTYTYEFDLVKTDGSNKLIDGAEFKLYTTPATGNPATHDGQTALYFVLDNGVYTKVKDNTVPNATDTLTVKDGKVLIKGLDTGTYYLSETKHPDGYNALDKDVVVEITATQDTDVENKYDGAVAVDSSNSTATGATIHYDETDVNDKGTYESGGVRVINKSGNLLPETGGIGTTIFYAVGGVLVVAAVVLLVTKKRMSTKD